jgi:hypothetical protein
VVFVENTKREKELYQPIVEQMTFHLPLASHTKKAEHALERLAQPPALGQQPFQHFLSLPAEFFLEASLELGDWAAFEIDASSEVHS